MHPGMQPGMQPAHNSNTPKMQLLNMVSLYIHKPRWQKHAYLTNNDCQHMLLKLMTPCDLVLLYHQALMSKGINTPLAAEGVNRH